MTTRTSFTGKKDGYTARLDIYPKGDYIVLDYVDDEGREMLWHVTKKSAFEMGKAIIDAAKSLPRV